MEAVRLQSVLEQAGRDWDGLTGETAGERLRRMASSLAEAGTEDRAEDNAGSEVNIGGELMEEIRRYAQRHIGEPIPQTTYSLFRKFGDTGSRLEFERVYFERRRRLNAFAIMAMAEQQRGDYLNGFIDLLWAICDEHTWCLPAHVGDRTESTGLGAAESATGHEWLVERMRDTTIDLFAAETAFALAEITAMTAGQLPEAVTRRVRSEIYRRVLWPYVNGGPFGWETATHNWAAVCAGSVGAAAIYLIQDERELSVILAKALGSTECYLSGFEDDGACKEGLGYWNYGFGFFVYFADLLKRRTRGAVDLFRSDKVHSIALFQQKCFLSGSAVANFSDSIAHIRIHMGITHYLNGIYTDVEIPDRSLRSRFEDDHCGRWAPAVRSLLWLREPGESGQAEESPERGSSGTLWADSANYLPDAQWLVSRYRGYGFAVKGGDNDEPHNHNDIGHFMLHADGTGCLIDLGCGEYTKDYFGEKRYAYDCNGSQGHSVPIVDGGMQLPGKSYRAKGVIVDLSEDVDRFELDMAEAYGSSCLISLRRRLEWHKSDIPELRLTDDYVFAGKPESVIERFISAHEVLRAGRGTLVVQGSRKLMIFYDEHQWVPAIEAAAYRDHFGAEQVYYRIDFRCKPDKLELGLSGTFRFSFKGGTLHGR
ncbi:heparinase II/III-family protein [Paenibacillus sp. sptzw28]|uniref:heparinase II/III family protein n=1 Tax=Paenibacillus sp. sptzw28 TaxID=715179 RepID=UPI001C6DDC9E|nr:heparinase II/III family protein [Paenibacillus sp. sptzw28]QYR22889.1 heparinase II/III-family protein [Paenibacillus sp. sptzw28]